jgi:predicted MFS family arabinose efflux permease
MVKPVNKIIRALIFSDFLLQAGWGLIGPIFAIFLIGKIQGGSVAMVGFLATAYWLTKSLIQPFIAHQFDKNHGEKDDFIFLMGGLILANLIPLGYIFVSLPWHIFLLEIIRGAAMACVVPTWSAIFTRHIDKGREAFSWSLESTSIGFAAGLAGAFGGLIAITLGFEAIFILVSAFGLLSSFSLFLVKRSFFQTNDPKSP